MWGGVFFAEKRGWVGEESAFFEFFLREVSTAPPPALPIYPRGGDPSPQRTRNGYTSQAAEQTLQEPGQTTQGKTHTPGRGHAAPVCTRCQTGRAGTIRAAARRWTACNVSGKVYNFGRFILSIFIWIYFAESIDNPYIYGYNIINPDKYGLQPQYTKTGGQNHDEQ